SAKPPFTVLKILDTGPITNHVNFAHNARGQFAYVTVGGLNEVQVFRTSDFAKVATIPVGKLPHGLWPSGDGTRGLQPLGLSGEAAHLVLSSPASPHGPTTSVSLFDQGLVQVLQASVAGLMPKQPYILALSSKPNGGGSLQPIAAFITNPTGSAIVDTVGPIRRVIEGTDASATKYLTIAEGTPAKPGAIIQTQQP